ncbi:hypothetical protein TNCV_4311451 [Trichonephila clavipes]|nr:hypothetical protein TNCV_4311451 [Trichonephila clavipes]
MGFVSCFYHKLLPRGSKKHAGIPTTKRIRLNSSQRSLSTSKDWNPAIRYRRLIHLDPMTCYQPSSVLAGEGC